MNMVLLKRGRQQRLILLCSEIRFFEQAQLYKSSLSCPFPRSSAQLALEAFIGHGRSKVPQEPLERVHAAQTPPSGSAKSLLPSSTEAGH